MEDLTQLEQQYESFCQMNLKLNIERGQPGDENFDLSNGMLTILDERKIVTESGVALRNYPGGVCGLPEARELFAEILGISADEMIVGNNSSLKLLSNTLMWAKLRGLKTSDQPWANGPVKMIVTVPGYDRHFSLLDTLGFEMVSVPMTPDGPDAEAIERLAGSDPLIKGLVFVPTYSNPTGETISAELVKRLAGMNTAAPDFTIFADDAYAVHHLADSPPERHNLLRACQEAGHPERVYLFGSTSKITMASAGIGFMGASEANVAYLSQLMGMQFIGPNKIEQYRHVLFLRSYPGGITGLMREHAKLLKPKFEIVQKVLRRMLAETELASWTDPKGGYFVSLDTARPIADEVVKLSTAAGVALTPAGATYPFGKDPHNRNIRISPTRPPVKEIEQAMEVVAHAVKLASARFDAAR